MGSPDTKAPYISKINPASGAKDIAIASDIVIDFSEPVVFGSGSIQFVNMGIGASLKIPVNDKQLSLNGSTLTINPSADLTLGSEYTIYIDAGFVKDEANNLIDYTKSLFYTVTAPDTTPPTVLSFSPADEATSVNIGSNINVTFSEAIQRGSGDIFLKTDSGTTVATYAQSSSNVTISGSTLTINPTADLNYSTVYKVEFTDGSVIDAAGNKLLGVNNYNFTTSTLDAKPPKVLGFNPADDATSIAIGSNITVIFDEGIQRGSGDIVLKTSAGKTLATYGRSSLNVTISGTTLTINPTEDLNYSTEYQVNFTTGSVQDSFGNNYTETNTYNFTTESSANTAPIAGSILMSTSEDVTLAGQLTAAGNGSSTLSYSKVSDASYGNLNINSNGTFTYIPNANFNGRDSFTFKTNDSVQDSAATPVSISVSAVNDSPIGTIDITGTAKQGERLTATKNWTDADGIPKLNKTFKTSWLVDGYEISPTSPAIQSAGVDLFGNFTGAGILLSADLAGKRISFSVAYTDNGGTLETVTSTATDPVANINDAPTGSLTISGTSTIGQVLTVSNTLADADGMGLISYQWLADGVNISDATNSTMTLTQAQLGKNISVKARYTDSFGTNESVTSTVTASVSDLASTSASAKFWKYNSKTPTDTKKADAVNLTDAIAILKMIVGLNVNSNNSPLSPYQAIAADFDQSGDVGLTDAIGVLKMVVGLSAPTPTWKYYDDTKLASTYTSAQSLNPKGWTNTAVISDTGAVDSSVKLVGVLTGDVDGSWTGV